MVILKRTVFVVMRLLWNHHGQSQRTWLRALKLMEERSHLQSGSRILNLVVFCCVDVINLAGWQFESISHILVTFRAIASLRRF